MIVERMMISIVIYYYISDNLAKFVLLQAKFGIFKICFYRRYFFINLKSTHDVRGFFDDFPADTKNPISEFDGTSDIWHTGTKGSLLAKDRIVEGPTFMRVSAFIEFVDIALHVPLQ